MLALHDVGPAGQSTAYSQSQQAVVASVVAQQRVIAAQRGADTGTAGNDDMTQRQDRAPMETRAKPASEKSAPEIMLTVRSDTDRTSEDFSRAKAAEEQAKFDMREKAEAQAPDAADRKVSSAHMAGLGLQDLLSVLRDPEDRLIPNEPEAMRV